MTFEFDPFKSASNAAKHGIDFVQAQALWDDPFLLSVPARLVGESRMFTIGMIDERYWVAVWTQRGVQVRIISVRRARKDEVDVYENGRI